MSDFDTKPLILNAGGKRGGGGSGSVANKAPAPPKTGQKNTDMQSQRTAKVADSDEIVAPLKVSFAVAKAIAQARQALNSNGKPKEEGDNTMTQKQLAGKIQLPGVTDKTIADYEAERAQPNQQVLGKLERTLNVKLTGPSSGIGKPLRKEKDDKKDAKGARNGKA